MRHEFTPNDQVLLFNSRLRLFPGKLKSRWSGPFKVKQVLPYGTIEITGEDGRTFRVHGQGLKHYFGGEVLKVESLWLDDPK